MGEEDVFRGETVLITGAAAGIGKACVHAFLSRGAAVAGADINPSVACVSHQKEYAGFTCDVTDEQAVCNTVRRVIGEFGGLDILVLNAGTFMPSRRIEDMPLADLRKVMSVNVEGNVLFLREAYPHLKKARRYGRVIVLGSQRAKAIAEGSAAYCISKAAVIQLARMAALEWARDGIRVNVVNPGRVCDTAVFTPDLLRARSARYNMTVDEYKRDNLLRSETTSKHVAELIAQLCGPAFEQTTGAQFPVDGGDVRVL